MNRCGEFLIQNLELDTCVDVLTLGDRSDITNIKRFHQNSGSGSVGGVCFWASKIPIRICNICTDPNPDLNPDPDPFIYKQNHDFYCFVTYQWHVIYEE